MSIINVYCEEIYWGEIFPEIYLIQAGKIKNSSLYKAYNNVKLKEGHFGLTISNDPFIAYSKLPVIYTGFYNEDLDDMKGWKTFEKFRDETRGYIHDMFKLMDALNSSGYSAYTHGTNVGYYISHKIAEYIQNNKPIEIRKFI